VDDPPPSASLDLIGSVFIRFSRTAVDLLCKPGVKTFAEAHGEFKYTIVRGED
jgi:hypothetical protein